LECSAVVISCSLFFFQDSQPTTVRNPAPDETTVATPPHKVIELTCNNALNWFLGTYIMVGKFVF